MPMPVEPDVPRMLRVSNGVAVPIPTSPLERTVMRVVPSVSIAKSSVSLVPMTAVAPKLLPSCTNASSTMANSVESIPSRVSAFSAYAAAPICLRGESTSPSTSTSRNTLASSANTESGMAAYPAPVSPRFSENNPSVSVTAKSASETQELSSVLHRQVPAASESYRRHWKSREAEASGTPLAFRSRPWYGMTFGGETANTERESITMNPTAATDKTPRPTNAVIRRKYDPYA